MENVFNQLSLFFSIKQQLLDILQDYLMKNDLFAQCLVYDVHFQRDELMEIYIKKHNFNRDPETFHSLTSHLHPLSIPKLNSFRNLQCIRAIKRVFKINYSKIQLRIRVV